MATYVWSRKQRCFISPEERMAERIDESKRSGLPLPYVISDNMDATLNHANGQNYTSKRAYERAVKEAGCEIVGNDSSFKEHKSKEYKPQGVARDIKRAIEEVSSR